MTKAPQSYDVVVFGAGAAGMSAALRAVHHGLRVVLLEKSEYFGGSTARSGGGVWIPGNYALVEAGQVEAGNLSVNSHSSVRYNTPFGGFKQSGLGRELGPDAPEHFTETKNVFFAMGDQ